MSRAPFWLMAAVLASLPSKGGDRNSRTNARTRFLNTSIPIVEPASSSDPYFEFATSSGVGMGTECSCSAVTGTKGQTLTFARTGDAWCMKAAYTWAKCATDQPRITVGETGLTQLGFLSERASQNDAQHNRDLTQASVWASNGNVSFAKNATGIDGVANSASTVTATSASGIWWQTITGSGSRSTSFFIRRRTGTGNINITREGGGGWVALAGVTSSWKRVQPQPCGSEARCIQVTQMKSTFTNPVVGWELVTSGDAVEIDMVQDEALEWASSPIETGGASAVRNTDDLRLDNPAGSYATFSMAAAVRPESLAANGSFPFSLRDASDFVDIQPVDGDGTMTLSATWAPGTLSAKTPVAWSSNISGAFKRIAAQWNGTTPKACAEGSCSNGTGSSATPASATAFNIGRSASSANAAANGVVHSICLDTSATKCL